MFKLFKRNNSESVYNPVNGTVISLDKVNDEVFSSKMMGEGFAISPKSEKIYSPVIGKITSIFPTKHAITIRTKYGSEVLVHIGIDSVSLEGKGFEIFVAQNDQVTEKTLLATINSTIFSGKKIDRTVIVVFPELEKNRLEINFDKWNEHDKIGEILEN